MVRQVLQHTSPLLLEADCPIRHFDRSSNIGVLLIKYIVTDPALFDAQTKANEISQRFAISVTIGGRPGVL
jgi:hypothetical protein